MWTALIFKNLQKSFSGLRTNKTVSKTPPPPPFVLFWTKTGQFNKPNANRYLFCTSVTPPPTVHPLHTSIVNIIIMHLLLTNFRLVYGHISFSFYLPKFTRRLLRRTLLFVHMVRLAAVGGCIRAVWFQRRLPLFGQKHFSQRQHLFCVFGATNSVTWM